MSDTEDSAPLFVIEKIYLKDASVEIPNSPKVFTKSEQPSIKIEMTIENSKVEEEIYEVVIGVSIKASISDGDVFLVELKQAAIFRLKNIAEEFMERVLYVECPSTIFPYMRESVSDLVVRAGFPPVYLNAVNFQAMLDQRKKAEEDAKANNQ